MKSAGFRNIFEIRQSAKFIHQAIKKSGFH